MPHLSNALIWFRRDLRATHHPALNAAVQHAAASSGAVLPIFVIDRRLVDPSGVNRIAVLRAALEALQRSGIPVQVVNGDPVELLPQLVRQHNAEVFATEDFGPYGSSRDRAVDAALQQQGQKIHFVDTPYLVSPGTVLKGDGTPFKVFTPFKRVWLNHALPQRPVDSPSAHQIDWVQTRSAKRAGNLSDAALAGLAAVAAPSIPEITEAAAWKTIDLFFEQRIDQYTEQRNLPGLDATSRISVYLKYGLVHPRQLLARIDEAINRGSDGAVTFLSELCWREFYADVLFHHPRSARQNFVANLDIEVDSGPNADQRFFAWCEGRTGFPFIDAGMRQLRHEGWMHNRVRMAVASFLVKDLHLPWQRGARWFMQNLIDGDIASNQHGWQWTAGTGTDAAPYFRIFNPITQGKKFDRDGEYIRRWIPELASLPASIIHEPWLVPKQAEQLFDPLHADSARYGYPTPIVNHAAERDESMRRFREVRGR